MSKIYEPIINQINDLKNKSLNKNGDLLSTDKALRFGDDEDFIEIHKDVIIYKSKKFNIKNAIDISTIDTMRKSMEDTCVIKPIKTIEPHGEEYVYILNGATLTLHDDTSLYESWIIDKSMIDKKQDIIIYNFGLYGKQLRCTLKYRGDIGNYLLKDNTGEYYWTINKIIPAGLK